MRNAAFEAEIREEIATEMREVMARLMEENAERLQDQVSVEELRTRTDCTGRSARRQDKPQARHTAENHGV